MSTNVNTTESNSDAVVSSAPPANCNIAGIIVHDSVHDSRVPGGEIGVLMDKDEKVGGDIVLQDSIDNAKVSVDDTSEQVMDKSVSDTVVSSEPVSNRDIETLTMKSTADHNEDDDIAVQDSVDDSRPSRDEKGVLIENIEKVNEVKIGADSLGLETETLTMMPSADHNEKVSDEIEVNEEKAGEYKVRDIVWAKVKNYPWWPGQIFDPSSATDKAKKFSNKKGFLVGYFGDQSFAWNKAPNIKPFRKNFCKLEKQSNSKPYLHAVDCALKEVSRRVEFGLACSCVPKEVYDNIKSQVFVNSGIREEDSKIDGGDRFSTVSNFKPVKVVQSVQDLAREHYDGVSRLEVLTVRSQLLAFFRWKGYYQLQAQDILDGPDDKLEVEYEVQPTEENKVDEDEKLASIGKKVSSKKKPDVCDSDDVTPKGNSSAKRSKKGISKKTTVDDDVIKEENGNEKPDSVGKKVSTKKRKPVVSESDSDDSVPRKKERSLTKVTSKGSSSAKRSKKGIRKKATVDDDVIKEENGNEKTGSVGKKVSSKKRKLVVSESDSDDSVARKKERSLTKVTSKGNSSAKRSKKGISKKATVDGDVIKEEKGNETQDSAGKKVSSKKGKPVVSESDSDDSVPHKKEKGLTKMTSKVSVKSSNSNMSKKATLKENGNGTDNKKSSISSPKMFRIGDSICKIAKQISESPSIVKKESEKSKNDEKSLTLRKTAEKDGQPVEE